MKASPTITGPALHNLFEEARDASVCRDLAAMRSVLAVFWPDIEAEPELSGFDQAVQGEWLRHCGWYLSELGRARGMDDQQLRGKDLLTRAIELFDKVGRAASAAEARIVLANCYYFAGEFEEFDALLDAVESEFPGPFSHPIALKVQLNRMIVCNWRRLYEESSRILVKICEDAPKCEEQRIRIQFHNLAGITTQLTGDFATSVEYLMRATTLSRQADNYRFAGMSLNSLAMTWRAAGEYEKAHNAVAEAIEIFATMRYNGWLAHAFDTLALIYLDERSYGTALSSINQAVDMFSRGEDAAGLADAMWTKVRCLFRLGRTADGVLLFSDLSRIVTSRIGESALKRYSALLEDEIYLRKGFALPDEVASFKKSIVRGALARNGGEIVRSSGELGIAHQTLSEILNRQFPELYSELGLSRRKRRPVGQKKDPLPRGVSLFEVNDLKYTLPIKPRSSHIRFFHICPEISSGLGLKGENVVAVVLDVSPCKGMTVLYTHREKFHLGKIIRENETGLPAISLDDGFFLFLDDVNVIGVPVAFCRAREAASSDNVVSFKLLPGPVREQ